MAKYEPRPDLTDRERLIVIEQMLAEMKDDLFGNGQPGKIAYIEKEIDLLKQFRWKALGALAVLSIIITVLTNALPAIPTLLGGK